MIVKLMGGLGNQLWQAAFGLSVGAVRGEEVFFSYDPNWRPYGLGAYRIDAHLDNETPILYREPGFAYDPGVYSAPRSATFIGYWQTPRYFNEGLVRAAFTLRHYEGRSIAEIGHTLGLGTSAAKHSIFRAVRKLRVVLGPMRGES